MRDNEIGIVISATSGIDRDLRHLLPELENYYTVERRTIESYSNVDGSPEPEYIKLLIETGSNLVDWVKEEGLEFIIKTVVLAPLLNWLSKVETDLDGLQPDEITYQFGDIEIKVGYSKKNHVNIIAVLCKEINGIKKALEEDGLRKLTMVATPLETNGRVWHLYSPDSNFQFSDFLQFLGLELNKSNRCVFIREQNQILLERWYG